MRSLIILIFVLFEFSVCYSQSEILYENKIYKDNIKTVLFFRDGWEFTYPVLELYSDKQLVLKFDDLAEETTDYYYTVIHCNSDWEPSNLNPIEYIEGFDEEELFNYENSFNTLVPYTHYTLRFPNESMKPRLSGNYLLLVYEDYDKGKPVLSRRFFIVDNKIKIEAEVKRPTFVRSIDDSQEISFKIADKNNIIYNPIDNLHVIISQNNDQNFILKDIKPDFIKGDIFEFNNSRQLLFKGGNEFRYFNLKSYRNVNQRIRSISYNDPYYIFETVKETSEKHLPYSYVQDINGGMLVIAENIENYELESEYVFVDFTFVSEQFLTNGDFYVYGALSDYDINQKNKMAYDHGLQEYKLRMLLKQGFYNYEYVFVEEGSNTIDLSLSEGNHFETENFYVIYVYHSPQGSDYEQLIGYYIVNTTKKL